MIRSCFPNTCLKAARRPKGSRVSTSSYAPVGAAGYNQYMKMFQKQFPKSWGAGVRTSIPMAWLDPSVPNSNFFYVKLQRSRKKGHNLEAHVTWMSTAKPGSRINSHTKARMKYVTSCIEYFLPTHGDADRGHVIDALSRGMKAVCHRRSARGKALIEFMDDYLSEKCGAHEFSILVPELGTYD